MLFSGKITHNLLTLSAVDIKLMFNYRPVADVVCGMRYRRAVAAIKTRTGRYIYILKTTLK